MNRPSAVTTVAASAAQLSRLVASVPERLPRALSGTAFSLDGARACSDPARLACIARLLRWLAPLNPLTGDEQRALGLNGGLGRAVAASDEPGEAEIDELPAGHGHGDCTPDLVH